MSLTVTVSKDLEDLVPGFLKNRRKELDALQGAHRAGDFEQIRMIGHRMKGVGNSFGFDAVSRIGAALETEARASNLAGIAGLLDEYLRYLNDVQVVYA